MIRSERWLIAVTAGRWQLNGILEAQAAGLRVLALDADPSAVGLQAADAALCMPLNDEDAVVAALRQLGKPYAGVVSFASEAGMRLAARLRAVFGLPGPDEKLTHALLSKVAQRRAWDAAGVPGPRWRLFTDQAGAVAELRSGGAFPCVVKPADSSGSRGVTKLESVNDDLVDAVARAFAFAKSSEILVEAFMEGTEFTVETFAENGKFHVLAVTEKKKVEGTRGTVASELASPDRDAKVVGLLSRTVVAAYQALGYRDGPGHAEIILGPQGQVGLVEVAGRGGGFMVFDRLVPAISGFNVARATALQAAGQPFDRVPESRQAAVLRFFPSRPGVLRHVSGMLEANAMAGVEAGAFVEPGTRFHRAIADGDRLGYILAVADNPSLAQARADAAESCIRFDIEATE